MSQGEIFPNEFFNHHQQLSNIKYVRDALNQTKIQRDHTEPLINYDQYIQSPIKTVDGGKIINHASELKI